MTGAPPLAEGEHVLLRRKEGEAYLLALRKGPHQVEDLGVLDLSAALGQPEGCTIEVAGRAFQVLRPRLPDLVAQMRRRSQIITPKDAVTLLYLSGVAPGSKVLEAGTGSGGLTLFLAVAVGTQGKVVSYDRRPEHQKVARENLERSGLLDRVDLRIHDVKEGFGETEADAVLLDLPDPWEIVAAAKAALKIGGVLTTYTPTYNQLERTVRAIREAGLQEVRALETLERGLHVGEGGTRPEFEMLGHTGFLAAARRFA
jgi:tRNA (adenine57-N1/adenine58-N1)-methyltransferase catalytic subunit